MRILCFTLFLAGLCILLIRSANAGETVVGHWADHGFANTTTAGNALSIDADVTAKKDDAGGAFLDTHVKTSNGALIDNGTGCAKIGLLNGNMVVASYVACSPQNPGRGLPFNGNTVREGNKRDQVPVGTSFDGIAFAFYNSEFCCEPVDIGNLIKIGAMVFAPSTAH